MKDGGLNGSLSGHGEAVMGRRQKDRRALRFKVHRMKADWLREGGQGNDWTRAIMSTLI